MSLNNIKGLLERFRDIEPTDRRIKRAFQAAIKAILDIDIEPADITVSRDIVFLKTHPVVRSEIMLKKKEVLRMMSAELGPKVSVSDIR
jgi:hypothetical protein